MAVTNNAATFQELQQQFDDKLNFAKAYVNLRGGWSVDTIEEIGQYSTEVKKISNELELYRESLIGMRFQMQKVKSLVDEMEFLTERLMYMKTQLPQHLPCLATHTIDSHHSEVKDSKQYQNSLNEKTDVVPSQTTQKGIVHLQNGKVVAAKNFKVIPKVQYITTDEFENVPKYIRGRIQYDQVNSAIDGINMAVESKYALLRKPRSKLSPIELSIVEEYKKQKDSETTGLYFVVSEDIKKFSNLKLNTVGRNILTILRTLRRLKEVRGSGSLVRYCVLTSF